jgi:hypothetical protein
MTNLFNKDDSPEVTEEMIEAITSSEAVDVFSEEDLAQNDESSIDWETL